MSKITIFIIFIIILSIILFLRHKYFFFNIKKNPWINSCKSYSVYTKDSKKYLEADLLYTENDSEEKVRKIKYDYFLYLIIVFSIMMGVI